MRGLLIAAMCGFLCACAVSQTGGGLVPGQSLKSGSKILVMPIPDGVERTDGPARGSGAAMTAGFRDTLIKAGRTPLLSETTSLEQAFGQAKRLGYQYVVKATLTEWEDNATEWSGRPDSAALSAELYDVESLQLVATATHREKGSAMALIPETPERFIPILSHRVVSRLLGVSLPEPTE